MFESAILTNMGLTATVFQRLAGEPYYGRRVPDIREALHDAFVRYLEASRLRHEWRTEDERRRVGAEMLARDGAVALAEEPFTYRPDPAVHCHGPWPAYAENPAWDVVGVNVADGLIAGFVVTIGASPGMLAQGDAGPSPAAGGVYGPGGREGGWRKVREMTLEELGLAKAARAAFAEWYKARERRIAAHLAATKEREATHERELLAWLLAIPADAERAKLARLGREM